MKGNDEALKRPDFERITSGSEFNTWYWLKAEMVEICKQAGLPYTGSKFELRDRIMYALDHNGAVKPRKTAPKRTSSFNWAKAELTPDTFITDNVSFGPNFRRFMKAQIGTQFSCHSDFMDWVKAHPGKTLHDAVLKWQELEDRKKDPDFQRSIAEHNMLSQYVRDFLADNPTASFQHALKAWAAKRRMPMVDGRITYSREDTTL